MKQRIAILCCVMMIQSSVVIAGETGVLFGGVSAGIGALAGWGIGRSQDDGYHSRSATVSESKSRKRLDGGSHDRQEPGWRQN